MQVEDFCFPGPYLKPLTETPSCCAKDHNKFLLLLSGLDFVAQVNSLELELLSDWITGLLGDESVQEEAANIVRIIIAGKVNMYINDYKNVKIFPSLSYEIF